jgi:4-hydroxy-4-methyl-2-oxoglutarate aldolase
MEANEFDGKYRRRFEKLATTNLADALDKIGARGAVIGIRPMYQCPKIIGKAVTIKITAAGMAPSKYHLGVRAIDAASPGMSLSSTTGETFITTAGVKFSPWGLR